MDVIIGEYVGKAIHEIDYEIYNNWIASACRVIENKQYDRNKRELVEAPESFCVSDLFDGQYVNFLVVYKIQDVKKDEYWVI